MTRLDYERILKKLKTARDELEDIQGFFSRIIVDSKNKDELEYFKLSIEKTLKDTDPEAE